MIKKKRISILLISIFTFLLLSLSIQSHLEAIIYGSISGKVIDEETKLGIKGVKVSLWRAKGDAACAITATDKDANFRFEMLESGKYKLKFYPDPPYAFEDRFDEVYLDKGKIINFTKSLKYGGGIFGKVDFGEGYIPSEPIRISSFGRMSSRYGFIENDGNYKIEGLLPDDDYKITIQEDGYIWIYIKGVKVSKKGMTHLDIKFNLADPTGVEGSVTSEFDGRPIEGISVGMVKIEDPEIYGFDTTDKEGRFSITGAPQGLYGFSILYSKGGEDVRKTYDIYIEKGKKTKLNIVLDIPSYILESRIKKKNLIANFFHINNFYLINTTTELNLSPELLYNSSSSEWPTGRPTYEHCDPNKILSYETIEKINKSLFEVKKRIFKEQCLPSKMGTFVKDGMSNLNEYRIKVSCEIKDCGDGDLTTKTIQLANYAFDKESCGCLEATLLHEFHHATGALYVSGEDERKANACELKCFPDCAIVRPGNEGVTAKECCDR